MLVKGEREESGLYGESMVPSQAARAAGWLTYYTAAVDARGTNRTVSQQMVAVRRPHQKMVY